jgi:tRNA (guanine-N7-)-methyltransferase
VAAGPPLDLTAVFGRDAPLIVEIGPGTGESLVPMALQHRAANLLAFEVYQPALARVIGSLSEAELDHVRVVEADAVDGLSQLLPPESIDSLWMFFPDPWPKARHHKRRILSPAFADLVASRLKPGARWRLATDWAHYAGQMRDVLDGDPRFRNEHLGWAPRWSVRPVTRFEQRGLDAGRPVFDLTYQRV